MEAMYLSMMVIGEELVSENNSTVVVVVVRF